MTTWAEVDAKIDLLGATALQIKRERDIAVWRKDRYREALLALLDWFEDRMDIDGNGNPDAYMQQASLIREALGKS